MPRKHCRSRVRSRGAVVRTAETERVKLFAFHQTDEKAWERWNCRTVSHAHAQELYKAGDAQRVTREVNGRVEVVGYRVTEQAAKKHVRARRSPCTLTMGTMNAVAKHASADELSAGEQRQVEKFVAWPFIGDERNPATVRPRISEADRQRARGMFCRGGLTRAAA